VAQLIGNWRIVAMDLWDRDAIELMGPAVIECRADGTGMFRFVAVAVIVVGSSRRHLQGGECQMIGATELA